MGEGDPSTFILKLRLGKKKALNSSEHKNVPEQINRTHRLRRLEGGRFVYLYSRRVSGRQKEGRSPRATRKGPRTTTRIRSVGRLGASFPSRGEKETATKLLLI